MQLVHHLSDSHICQLHQLYQNEWWSRGRALEDTIKCVQGSSLIFAFIEQDQLVAFARVLTDGVFKAFLFDVIIAPGKRGQGVGQSILNAVKSDARLAAVKHLELYCREDLIPYYRELGFSTDVGPIHLMRLTTHACD